MNPLHDAVSHAAMKEGYSILKWGWSSEESFRYCKESYQLPTDVVDQILAWRDDEKSREALKKGDQ